MIVTHFNELAAYCGSDKFFLPDPTYVEVKTGSGSHIGIGAKNSGLIWIRHPDFASTLLFFPSFLFLIVVITTNSYER